MNDMPQETTHPFEKANLGKAPFRCIGYEVLRYQACPGAPVQVGGCCDYCGTGIMHSYKIKGSDGRTFKVGCDCVAKTDRVLHAELKAARRQARLDVIACERAKHTAEALEATFTKYPELREALTCEHPIVQSISAKFAEGGWISPRQAQLVCRLAEEKAIRDSMVGCAEPPAVPVPAAEGRVLITGRIVHFKTVDSMFGSTLKMLIVVRTPEGSWKAWLTVPAFLRPIERGQVVSLMARVEVSKDDPAFAFLSRPTAPKPPKQPKRKTT